MRTSRDPVQVSVVMATYDGSRFLAAQLKSLLRQSLRPAELIVADDASSDDTLAIVELFRSDFEAQGTIVTVIARPERLGYGENFLSAAQRATGDYLAFCDQDDIWHPNKLAVAVSELKSRDAVLHVHGADIIDDEGRRTGHFRQRIYTHRICPPGTLPPWGVYYGFSLTLRTDLLHVLPIADRGRHTFEHEGLLSHDLWAYFLASSLGSVVLDPRRLAAYRRHGSNETPALARLNPISLFRQLGWSVDPEHSRAKLARERADLLSTLLEHPRIASLAAQEVLRWRKISRYEEGRIALYRASTATGQLGALARLLRTGAYRSARFGGLGQWLAVKDVVMVAALRRRRSAAVTA